MIFSQYAFFGPMQFGGSTPAEALHEAARKAYGYEENASGDVDLDAELFADACLSSFEINMAERVRRENDPATAQTMLTRHADEVGAARIPGELDADKRRRVAALRALRPDGTFSAIYSALDKLLGDRLLGYSVTPRERLTRQDTSPPASDNYAPASDPVRILRTLAPIVQTGQIQSVSVEPVDKTTGQLVAGTVVVIDGGNPPRAERVTLTRTGERVLTGRFYRAHDAGTIIRTGRFPAWISRKRTHSIVLSNTDAVSATLRAAISEIMFRAASASDQWQVLSRDGADNGFVAGGLAGTMAAGTGL